MIYYYGWQFTLAVKLLFAGTDADVVHNLNFHNDWTPSFLWMLGKPFVWGPVGHHPKLPRTLAGQSAGRKGILKDRLLWLVKCWFWYLDPFLYITKRKADHILCMNSEAVKKLRLRKGEYTILPSVGCERPEADDTVVSKAGFTVLSAGRFVPLKGFDLTIKAFAKFYRNLEETEKKKAALVLIGSGPMKKQMEALIRFEGIEACTRIISWIPRAELLQIYRSASLFLFPSHEGAGMVVAEAMSYGLPVLCLRNSGPGEFLHPQCQLGVSADSYKDAVAELAGRLRSLYYDQAFFARESQLALERFQTQFDWDAKGRRLNNIYTTMVQSSNMIARQEVLA
jgi:glycosyltransferase involved in cell wall biosynthesis